MIGPRRREDFDVLIQLRADVPVMTHAVEISEIDSQRGKERVLNLHSGCNMNDSRDHIVA